MPVKLNSSGGGSVTLTPASTASDFTATFPAATGNVVTDSAAQTLTNKTLSSPLVMGASVITSGVAQASTSGTNVDFTGIPSWVKRVTVMFNGVSLSGAAHFLIQVGTSSGFTTSGYVSGSGYVGPPTSTGTIRSTAGFVIFSSVSTNVLYGGLQIAQFSGTSWTSNHSAAFDQAGVAYAVCGGGAVTLAAALDRVRITNTGSDTFDAGSINILYE